MSPPLGRVQAALARREGGAPGMARGARRVSRNGVFDAATGDSEIATPRAIAPLSASCALAVGRGGPDRRRGRSGSARAQRALQGNDSGLQLLAPRALGILHAPAVAARIAPGREREGERGCRLRGEERVLIEDDEAAIEELAQFDATAGVGVAAGPRRDLEPAGAQPDGVVPRDDPRVAAAQDALEIARGRPPRGRGRRGRAREALNEGGQELREKRVGLLQGMERAQAQFADEAVLQGAPEAFDTAFGLRRLSGDEPDAEILEHAPEVGGVLLAAQLFLERPVPIIATEEIEAIAVERHGDAVLPACLFQHGGVAVEIFGGPEPEGERGGGGIIDEPVQGGRRPALLEPGEGAGVELSELPHRGSPRAPAPMLGCPAGALGRPPERPPNPAHGGPAYRQGVVLLKLLGEVDVVEARVGCRHERDDLGAEGGWHSARRGLAAAAMHQAPHALSTEAGLEPLELPHAHTQRSGALLVRDLAGQGRFDEPGAWHFLPAHRESLHEGRTLSRSS